MKTRSDTDVTSGATSAPRPPAPGARLRRLTWTAVAVLAVSVGPTACAGSPETPRPTDSRWAEGITPEWMSEQMGLGIPGTAQASKAAYEITARFDTGLLTFTLTRPEAEAYLAKNPPKGKWLKPTAAATDVPPHDFAHLGLPEPEKFKTGMRYGYVCPAATETPQNSGAPAYDTSASDEQCVRLYAHDYAPDRTRIYLRAHFEPGISPLPEMPPASPSTD
ncbi:hypothetical protein [Streptomyces sp. MN13]